MSGPDVLSGASGNVVGPRARLRATIEDSLLDLRRVLRAEPWRLALAARAAPPRRRVLVIGVEREGVAGLMPGARDELARSRHEVEVATTTAGGGGKWENLNHLLETHSPVGRDWLIVMDDDVALPRGFLDAFLFLAERFGLQLAQPAHRRHSHAAWSLTRRAASVVRETAWVEIGPVTAFRAETFTALTPFPPLRAGWGLDFHWAALAQERGWRLGVIDATPVRHGLRLIAGSYGHEEALAEARDFLDGRRYLPASEAQRTLAQHRGW